jgi:hypothetical protein
VTLHPFTHDPDRDLAAGRHGADVEDPNPPRVGHPTGAAGRGGDGLCVGAAAGSEQVDRHTSVEDFVGGVPELALADRVTQAVEAVSVVEQVSVLETRYHGVDATERCARCH